MMMVQRGTVAGPAAAAAPASAGSSAWPAPSRRTKRKAESQDNERLSKRLSLLNLERSGSKLYVPVETPSSPPPAAAAAADDDAGAMQLDDSAHKVYIYNMDDELSSDSEPEDGRLVLLPDLGRHLRESRIPPAVLPNRDGELAGMQLVLYSDPRSLSVPEECDGVRRAVLDARRRLREQQQRQQQHSPGRGPDDDEPVGDAGAGTDPRSDPAEALDADAMDVD